MALSQLSTCLLEGQWQEWQRRKTEWQANFVSTYTEMEARKAMLKQPVDNPDQFPAFEQFCYCPARDLIKTVLSLVSNCVPHNLLHR